MFFFSFLKEDMMVLNVQINNEMYKLYTPKHKTNEVSKKRTVEKLGRWNYTT